MDIIDAGSRMSRLYLTQPGVKVSIPARDIMALPVHELVIDSVNEAGFLINYLLK